MDRGVWRALVQSIAKSQTWLSMEQEKESYKNINHLPYKSEFEFQEA